MEAKQSLGDRMKAYERLNDVFLDKTKPYIIRLDGHSFSKFTGSLQQPWDFRFMAAMVMTTFDLVSEFTATTGYTQSDEITLTFFPKPNADSGEYPALPYNGKIQKIVSLTAGFASARFNFHLVKLFADPTYWYCAAETRDLNKEEPLKAMDKINASRAHFDSRCFQMPSTEEVFNCVLWRVRDAYKNVVSKVAQSMFGVKPCFKKNTSEKLVMIAEKAPDYFATLHPFISHGVFVKKVLLVLKNADEDVEEPVIRSKMSFVPATNVSAAEIDKWCSFLETKVLTPSHVQ
jgi:tRNA(His) guanylyltransferase